MLESSDLCRGGGQSPGVGGDAERQHGAGILESVVVHSDVTKAHFLKRGKTRSVNWLVLVSKKNLNLL